MSQIFQDSIGLWGAVPGDSIFIPDFNFDQYRNVICRSVKGKLQNDIDMEVPYNSFGTECAVGRVLTLSLVDKCCKYKSVISKHLLLLNRRCTSANIFRHYGFRL